MLHNKQDAQLNLSHVISQGFITLRSRNKEFSGIGTLKHDLSGWKEQLMLCIYNNHRPRSEGDNALG